MDLNTKQKKILKWCTGIILLMLLFPPYTAYNGYRRVQEDLGFNLIFVGAKIQYDPSIGAFDGTIKFEQLLMQWFGVAIVGAGFIFAAKD